MESQAVVETYFKNSKKPITAENNVVKMAKDLVASVKRGFATPKKVVAFPTQEKVESFALAA